MLCNIKSWFISSDSILKSDILSYICILRVAWCLMKINLAEFPSALLSDTFSLVTFDRSSMFGVAVICFWLSLLTPSFLSVTLALIKQSSNYCYAISVRWFPPVIGIFSVLQFSSRLMINPFLVANLFSIISISACCIVCCWVAASTLWRNSEILALSFDSCISFYILIYHQ